MTPVLVINAVWRFPYQNNYGDAKSINKDIIEAATEPYIRVGRSKKLAEERASWIFIENHFTSGFRPRRESHSEEGP